MWENLQASTGQVKGQCVTMLWCIYKKCADHFLCIPGNWRTEKKSSNSWTFWEQMMEKLHIFIRSLHTGQVPFFCSSPLWVVTWISVSQSLSTEQICPTMSPKQEGSVTTSGFSTNAERWVRTSTLKVGPLSISLLLPSKHPPRAASKVSEGSLKSSGKWLSRRWQEHHKKEKKSGENEQAECLKISCLRMPIS